MKYKIEATCCNFPGQIIKDYPCLFNFGYEDEHVIINTLEDLMRLIRLVHQPVIVSDNYLDDEPTIEIYDGWRE